MDIDDRTADFLRGAVFSGQVPDEIVVRDSDGAVINELSGADIDKAIEEAGTSFDTRDATSGESDDDGNPPVADGGHIESRDIPGDDGDDGTQDRQELAEMVASEMIEELHDEGVFDASEMRANPADPLAPLIQQTFSEKVGNPTHSQHTFTLSSGIEVTFSITMGTNRVALMPLFNFGNMDVGDLNWELSIDDTFEWGSILLTQDVVDRGLPPSNWAGSEFWGFTIRDTMSWTVTNNSGSQQYYEDTLSLYEMDEAVFETVEDVMDDMLSRRWGIDPTELKRVRGDRR